MLQDFVQDDLNVVFSSEEESETDEQFDSKENHIINETNLNNNINIINEKRENTYNYNQGFEIKESSLPENDNNSSEKEEELEETNKNIENEKSENKLKLYNPIEDRIKEDENIMKETIPYAIKDDEDISKFDLIENPAIKYPFELDEFQKRSIIRLEENKNVLVCAHTSSGKTVVAEYGIALGKKHSKKVLYTSPIKALSNQKYREFKKRFDDVGILTGDVNINPDAQCLIMTTEILQNIIHKKNEILSQVEWIIFDEIHYITDNERGHVWEEILILLPYKIGLIMLSATVPNYMEFAKWVGSIKKTTVYVEITLKRIVPLKHQIYIDSQNVFEVKNIDGEVYDYNIREALNNLKEINERKKAKYGNRKADEQQIRNSIKYFMEKNEKYYKKYINNYQKTNKDNLKISKMHYKLMEMVDYLQKNNLCPAVIFVFSIKKITEYTRMLSNKNLLNEEEKNKITNFFNEVISSKLSKEDQEIPQISETLEILKSGIGLHHAGLLPIIKEIIELLYSQGLIKVLFATTSFSIGLNMPTKTVVFTDIYKFNEIKKEILSSSEYLQMCGRAGRRGIDNIGNVFLLLTDQTSKNEDQEIINMLKGEGTDVKSKLRLSYKTILSFWSRDNKNMEIFVQESFLESRKALSIPEKIKEIKELKEKSEKLKFKCLYDKKAIKNSRENICLYKIKSLINNDNDKNDEKQKKELDIEDFPCKDYYLLNEKYIFLNKNFFSNELIFKRLLKYNTGTILKVRNKEKFFPKLNKGNYVMLIHIYSPNSESIYKGKLWCLRILEYNRPKIKDVDIYNGECIGIDNIKEIDKNIFKEKNEYKGYKYFYEFYNEEEIINIYDYPYVKVNKYDKENIIKEDGKYYFNYKKDFEIILRSLYFHIKDFFIEKESKASKLDYDYSKYINNDSNYKNILSERKEIKNDAKKLLCYNCPKFKEHIDKFYEYKSCQNKIEEINKDIKPENMVYFDEFNIRKNILKELNYINEDNFLSLKGKAAREINTTDCLIVTEILTSDIFSELSDGEIVAFLSGFTTNKNKIEIEFPNISENLNKAYKKFLEIYDTINKIEEKYGFEENKYNRRFMSDVSIAIKHWMEGASFGEICKLTELEEGKLYNLILRIYIFLEEILNFYTFLGIVKESKRFSEIKNSLLRGIMGVQSLYLEEKINIDLNQ